MSRSITVLSVLNFAGLLVLVFLFISNKPEKIVYIDSAKVINSYQGMVKARQEYQGKLAVWKGNIDTLATEVQQSIKQYEKDAPKMTAKEKDLSRQLIKTKQQQLAEYQRAISDKAQQEDAEATRKVIDEINAYIRQYGEAHDYTIVLATTEQGNIAFAKKHLDITDAIIQGLNGSVK